MVIRLKELNVLILSIGRRVELVKLFKKAAEELKINSKIIAGDANMTAPGLYFSDKFYQLPYIDSANYIEEIINISNNENISLIVPTIDTELSILSRNKKDIERKTNAIVLVSDERVMTICRDKIHTQKWMEEHGFLMPKMLEIETVSSKTKFPLFIKPKSGSSSIGAYKINNIEELELYSKTIKDPILQEFAEGEEYTVDVFLDFHSNVISVVPRLRVLTRGGEISKGKIIKDREIIDTVIRLMEKLKPVGHITVQLMKKESKIQFIEINPRFGGGAPMSILSGANSPKYLFQLLLGEKLNYYENYRENIQFLRFDDSICIDGNMEVIEFD